MTVQRTTADASTAGTGRPGVTPLAPLTPRTAAVIAGWSYVAILVLAVFGNLAVSSLLVVDEPRRTLDDLAGAGALLRLGTAALLVVCVLDVVVAWGLHSVLAAVDRRASVLAAWLRVTFAAIMTVAVAALVVLGSVATGSGPGVAFDGADRAGQTVLLGSVFFSTWTVGLLLFGIHLVVVGALVVRARVAPRLLGWLLVAAGLGYCLNTFARILLPDYAALEPVFLAIYGLPSFTGELWLALWLVRRAAR